MRHVMLHSRTSNVRPRYNQTEIYAGRIACCPLASHVECAPRVVVRLEKRRDGRTDGRTDGQTPDRCSTLSDRRGRRAKSGRRRFFDHAHYRHNVHDGVILSGVYFFRRKLYCMVDTSVSWWIATGRPDVSDCPW